MRRVRPARKVLEGRVVRADEAGPRAAFDAHVADRHALLHRQRANRLTGVLEDVAGAATDTDPGDQREDDVLRADARSQPAVDVHLVGLGSSLQQALRRQHHLDLAGADAERQRAEGAMRARVAVAAHDGHPGLGQAQLRSDHVDDALSRRAKPVERDAELAAIGLELGHLRGGHRVQDRQPPIMRRHRMVRRRDGLVGAAHPEAAGPKPGECLRARHLVDEVKVDRKDRRGIRLLGDQVVVPDLVDEGARRAGGS
jgi:hypothetical protein